MSRQGRPHWFRKLSCSSASSPFFWRPPRARLKRMRCFRTCAKSKSFRILRSSSFAETTSYGTGTRISRRKKFTFPGVHRQRSFTAHARGRRCCIVFRRANIHWATSADHRSISSGSGIPAHRQSPGIRGGDPNHEAQRMISGDVLAIRKSFGRHSGDNDLPGLHCART